jgi:hypothetical protein
MQPAVLSCSLLAFCTAHTAQGLTLLAAALHWGPRALSCTSADVAALVALTTTCAALRAHRSP